MKFKLNDKTLRALAENSKLQQPLEDVEMVLTLNYLANRLLLAYQLEETFENITDGSPIQELKDEIVELIKSL